MTKQPEDTIRDGAIKATIWRNEGENGPYLSTDLARTYQDKDGELQDSRSFGLSDLLKVAEVARNAYGRGREIERTMRVMLERSQAQGQDEGEAQPAPSKAPQAAKEQATQAEDRKAFVEKRREQTAPQQKREPSR